MVSDSFDKALEQVRKLVLDYDANKPFFISSEYNESQARKDFIDKFLIALGWDVNHETQKNPYKQEVKVERTVPMGQSQRSADYALYISPNFREPKLFVEAKKPYGDLTSAENCFQTIRYGWNANTYVAILTNFDQFVVLDCRYKPDINSAAKMACQVHRYSDYGDAETFSKIFYLASRDAVAAGSLEKLGKSLPRRKGRAVSRGLYKEGWQPVDEAFLEELDSYREELARNFKNHNQNLDGDTLTEVTQRTLDRLVFLRFIEDKAIEQRAYVSEFVSKENPWLEFVASCSRLDQTYNGVIFKHHNILDAPTFNVDEAHFAGLCKKLEHINSAYDFNFIPIHILGSIYERFLGKVIIATNRRAHVELKPEVRKAGGVYYTPDYIVRHIVANTIEKLIAGKNPAQIAEMRFADISCGSGSFLLAMYDSLLQYYVAWYNEHPDRAEKDGCIRRDDGFWKLSLRQRRNILLKNIYGVDIDHQAVEVAQLSLYLKLLEDETTSSAHNYQLEFRETLLPSLADNIKLGNSLIASDFSIFPDELIRVRAFDWNSQFPEQLGRGGFDAIIGNPPWISITGRFGSADCSDEEVKYLISRFRGNTYMPNMYEYFISQGMSLVKKGGFLSFVVPDRFGFNAQFVELRRKMLSEFSIHNLLYKVPFPGITADTLIFVAQKDPPKPTSSVYVAEFNKPYMLRKQKDYLSTSNCIFEYFEDSAMMKLVRRLENPSKFSPLSAFCDTTSGYGGKSELIYAEQQNRHQIPTLKGDSIGRYETRKKYWFDFQPKNITGRTTDKLKLGAIPKILLRKTGSSIVATFDESGIFPEQSLYFLYNFIPNVDPLYILGLLNSTLLNYFYRAKSLTNKKSIAQVKKVDLDSLPILSPTSVEKMDRDELTAFVNKMLSLSRSAQGSHTEAERDILRNALKATDARINQLVYRLYGIEKADILIIESQ